MSYKQMNEEEMKENLLKWFENTKHNIKRIEHRHGTLHIRTDGEIIGDHKNYDTKTIKLSTL